MNETLQKAVAVMIEKAISGIDTATNFLAAEIPDVIHQLLMWNLVKSVLIVGLCFSFLLISGAVAYKTEKSAKAAKDYLTTGFPTFIFSIFGIGPLVIMLLSLFEALKIWIAPKVWLIEYAAELVK